EQNAVRFQDIDCDGYRDILIQKTIGTSANTWYYLFRFHLNTGRFVEYERFAKISFVSVNCKDKTVKAYAQQGQAGCAYESDGYQWVQGELKRIRRESQVYDDGEFVRTIRTSR